MAANSEFFTSRAENGNPVVHDPPKFDLESYISNYQGRTKLDRLRTIGVTSTYLCHDALRMAVGEAKKGKDVDAYLQLIEVLQKIVPDDPLSIADMDWVTKTKQTEKAESDRLDQELKGYKNNMIRESIRMANEDIALHSYQTGDFVNSLRAYARAREFRQTARHEIELFLKLIMVHLATKQFHHLGNAVQRVLAQPIPAEDKDLIDSLIPPLNGLVFLSTKSYADAAKFFVSTPQSYTALEPRVGIDFQMEVMTGNDIAVYGGLTALASMSPQDLKENVLDSPTFRHFLELEPHIRRAISLFCSCKYSACLEILDSYRNDYLLDVYLQPHLLELYEMVRRKSIVQYFKPFNKVTLDEMQARFPTSDGRPIDDELVDMIKRGLLDARLDLVDRLLISPTPHPRSALQTQALEMAQSYERTLRLRLLRMNMVHAGMVVTGPKGRGLNFDSVRGGGMSIDGMGN